MPSADAGPADGKRCGLWLYLCADCGCALSRKRKQPTNDVSNQQTAAVSGMLDQWVTSQVGPTSMPAEPSDATLSAFTNVRQPSENVPECKRSRGVAGGSDWAAGDCVLVNGRAAVVIKDMRPRHSRATLRWTDTGERERRVDVDKIHLSACQPVEQLTLSKSEVICRAPPEVEQQHEQQVKQLHTSVPVEPSDTTLSTREQLEAEQQQMLDGYGSEFRKAQGRDEQGRDEQGSVSQRSDNPSDDKHVSKTCECGGTFQPGTRGNHWRSTMHLNHFTRQAVGFGTAPSKRTRASNPNEDVRTLCLPDCVALLIIRSVGHHAAGRTAMVCREFRATVGLARQLKLFRSAVLAVSAGASHTVVCMESGVYTFGSLRQIGQGGYQHEHVPVMVQKLVGEQVVGAGAGAHHTAVWNEEGEVFTFGDGRWCGQLGHDMVVCEYAPRRVQSLAGKKVVGAAAGNLHTVVWTEAGEVFTFGEGQHGQLGHGGDECEHVPKVVEELVGKKVLGAAAGEQHTVVWTDAGEVFTFGGGRLGQLGHGGNSDHSYVPRVVEALLGKKVVGAAAGEQHTVVWTEAGEVYSFGHGTCGQLGHGDLADFDVPRVVEALLGKKVVGAAAGAHHTILWSETGEAFTCGFERRPNWAAWAWRDVGRLPRLVKALSSKKVIGASAGANHTVVWLETGEVCAWGEGGCGRLGHGGENDEILPKVISHLFI